jgi:hypothetical protein
MKTIRRRDRVRNRYALLVLIHTAALHASNRRAELAIRFEVILRKVWGGSRTWPGGGRGRC